MEKPRNREVTVNEEIGFLTPIEILPRAKSETKVICRCRCGAKVKRGISGLRAALNGAKTPACRKCNRKAIRNSTFGDSVRLAHKVDPDGPYEEPRFNY